MLSARLNGRNTRVSTRKAIDMSRATSRRSNSRGGGTTTRSRPARTTFLNISIGSHQYNGTLYSRHKKDVARAKCVGMPDLISSRHFHTNQKYNNGIPIGHISTNTAAAYVATLCSSDVSHIIERSSRRNRISSFVLASSCIVSHSHTLNTVRLTLGTRQNASRIAHGRPCKTSRP